MYYYSRECPSAPLDHLFCIYEKVNGRCDNFLYLCRNITLYNNVWEMAQKVRLWRWRWWWWPKIWSIKIRKETPWTMMTAPIMILNNECLRSCGKYLKVNYLGHLKCCFPLIESVKFVLHGRCKQKTKIVFIHYCFFFGTAYTTSRHRHLFSFQADDVHRLLLIHSFCFAFEFQLTR